MPCNYSVPIRAPGKKTKKKDAFHSIPLYKTLPFAIYFFFLVDSKLSDVEFTQ